MLFIVQTIVCRKRLKGIDVNNLKKCIVFIKVIQSYQHKLENLISTQVKYVN